MKSHTCAKDSTMHCDLSETGFGDRSASVERTLETVDVDKSRDEL